MIVVFDLDKTLRKGFVTGEFLQFLLERGVFPKSSFDEQLAWCERFKNGELTYAEWNAAFGKLWADGFKGLSVADVNQLAKEFWKNHKNLFEGSKELVHFFAKKEYKTVCLTGALACIAQCAAQELGMDELIATELEKSKGIFTGGIVRAFLTQEEKSDFVQGWDLHYGFGDSHTDIGFMQHAKVPIAINPSEELKNWVEQRGKSFATVKEALASLEKH